MNESWGKSNPKPGPSYRFLITKQRDALLAENVKLRALLNDLLNEHSEMNAILLKQGRGANTNEMSPAGEARTALAGGVK